MVVLARAMLSYAVSSLYAANRRMSSSGTTGRPGKRAASLRALRMSHGRLVVQPAPGIEQDLAHAQSAPPGSRPHAQGEAYEGPRSLPRGRIPWRSSTHWMRQRTASSAPSDRILRACCDRSHAERRIASSAHFLPRTGSGIHLQNAYQECRTPVAPGAPFKIKRSSSLWSAPSRAAMFMAVDPKANQAILECPTGRIRTEPVALRQDFQAFSGE